MKSCDFSMKRGDIKTYAFPPNDLAGITAYLACQADASSTMSVEIRGDFEANRYCHEIIKEVSEIFSSFLSGSLKVS